MPSGAVRDDPCMYRNRRGGRFGGVFIVLLAGRVLLRIVGGDGGRGIHGSHALDAVLIGVCVIALGGWAWSAAAGARAWPP